MKTELLEKLIKEELANIQQENSMQSGDELQRSFGVIKHALSKLPPEDQKLYLSMLARLQYAINMVAETAPTSNIYESTWSGYKKG